MSSTPGWAKEWHPITYTQTFACLPGSPYFPVLARLAFLVNRTGAAVCKALSPQLSAGELSRTTTVRQLNILLLLDVKLPPLVRVNRCLPAARSILGKYGNLWDC